VPNPSLSPRKVPRQERSGATVAVILEAATRVLGERSLDGFNTNRVAEVAGVSVGSVYQYFPNKAALVSALITRAQAQLAQAIEDYAERSAARTLDGLLSGLVAIAIDHQFRNPVFAAALDHEEQRLPLEDVLSAARQRIISAVDTALRSHPALGGVRLPVWVAPDCLTIAKALIESESINPQPNLPRLRKRVLRALRGYLLNP
jgi:AcrR family transcriptional regulator